MTVTVSPATIFDLAELGGAVTRAQWGIARELFDRGQFFGFHAVSPGSGPGQPRDELIALGGLVPIDAAGLYADLYFNPAPAAARHVLGIVRAGRLTIEASPYRGIVTVCRSKAGAVLAARLGFTFQARTELGEVWGHGRSVDRGRRQGGEPAAAAAGGPDRVGAAAEPGAAGGATGPA